MSVRPRWPMEFLDLGVPDVDVKIHSLLVESDIDWWSCRRLGLPDH